MGVAWCVFCVLCVGLCRAFVTFCWLLVLVCCWLLVVGVGLYVV